MVSAERFPLSEKLKGLRKRAALTQKDIAKILNCSVAAVCGYEKGKNVPFEVRMEYSRYFGCQPEYLIHDDIPLMDEPGLLEKPTCRIKIPLLKNLALPATGKNVSDYVNHPLLDNPANRIAWEMRKDGEKVAVVIVQKTDVFREGDNIVAVLDGEITALGYYYVDESRNVCIKSKPKGEKGNRNIRIGLKPKDKIIGIVDCTVIK